MKKGNIVILLFLLVSCTKEYPITITPKTNPISMNGHLTSDTVVRVSLTRATGLKDQNNFENIGSAKVSLYENDQFVETLTYSPPLIPEEKGYYIGARKQFSVDKTYTIQAEIANGDTILTAKDLLPNNSAIIKNLIVLDTILHGFPSIYYTVELNDQYAETNFYHLYGQMRLVQWTWNGSDTNYSRTEWQEFPTDLAGGMSSEFIKSQSEPFLSLQGYFQGVMLNDVSFNTSAKAISFTIRNQYGISSNTFIETRVAVRSVSSNYFNYYFTTEQQSRSNQTFLSEPVIIHNNVENGLGNFSAYNTLYSTIVKVLP